MLITDGGKPTENKLTLEVMLERELRALLRHDDLQVKHQNTELLLL
jgi:hypothetical protein